MSIKIRQSETVAMNSRALALKARGVRVYNLSAGEPLVDLHPAINEAIARALVEQKTRYTPPLGIEELRAACASWMNTTYAASYTSDEICITPGGKFGIFGICNVLLESGDEVLVPAPYWVSYRDIPEMFGAVVRVLPTTEQHGWKLVVETLEHIWTKRTKFLFLNNAANPTGVLYTREELHALVAFVHAQGGIVVSDEVYSGLTYDTAPFFSCASFSEFRDSLIVIQSFSKHFAMTGFRVGWVAAQRPLISAVGALQSNSVTCASSISQHAARGALRHADEIIPSIRDALQKRRDCLVVALTRVFSQSFVPPQSSLYCFVPLRFFGEESMASVDFALALLEEGHVATVPGSAFGMEGYVRLSFGAVESELSEAVYKLSLWTKERAD